MEPLHTLRPTSSNTHLTRENARTLQWSSPVLFFLCSIYSFSIFLKSHVTPKDTSFLPQSSFLQNRFYTQTHTCLFFPGISEVRSEPEAGAGVRGSTCNCCFAREQYPGTGPWRRTETRLALEGESHRAGISVPRRQGRWACWEPLMQSKPLGWRSVGSAMNYVWLLLNISAALSCCLSTDSEKRKEGHARVAFLCCKTATNPNSPAGPDLQDGGRT